MVKVLVVDNDRDMCRVISDVLKEEGIKVNLAYDGNSALEKIKKTPHDVMVLDYRLSGMSGLTILEKVRQIRPKTRIIMISAFGDSSTKVRARELGVFDFLDKPFNIKKLIGIVKRALKKK